MPGMPHEFEDQFQPPSEQELERVGKLLRAVGGRNVQWGASNVLDVLVAEHRLRSERLTSERLMRATWVLAGATVVLALATITLIFATLAG